MGMLAQAGGLLIRNTTQKGKSVCRQTDPYKAFVTKIQALLVKSPRTLSRTTSNRTHKRHTASAKPQQQKQTAKAMLIQT